MKDGFCQRELWKKERNNHETALREVKEEAGVQASIIKYVGKKSVQLQYSE